MKIKDRWYKSRPAIELSTAIQNQITDTDRRGVAEEAAEVAARATTMLALVIDYLIEEKIVRDPAQFLDRIGVHGEIE